MITSRQRVMALVAKDFRIHGRDIALTQAGVIALIGLAMYLKPSEAAVVASLVLNFNVLLALFWGEWLISREKTKGTFAWLRACPIDDRDLVIAKFLAAGICCASLWVMSSVLFTRGYLLPHRPGVWIDLQIALLAFGALSLAARWRLGPKLGQMVPPALILAAAGAAMLLQQQIGNRLPVHPLELLRTSGGRVVFAAILVGCYLAIFWWTLAWVRRSDTSALLE